MSEFVDQDGTVWRKSSHSGPDNDCIEMAELADGSIGIRDTTDRKGPMLRVRRSDVRALVAGARDGEFDDFA